jgi:hypothetical protein
MRAVGTFRGGQQAGNILGNTERFRAKIGLISFLSVNRNNKPSIPLRWSLPLGRPFSTMTLPAVPQPSFPRRAPPKEIEGGKAAETGKSQD